MQYYSQHKDIHNPEKKNKGCGIAALAMLFSCFSPEEKYDLDALFDEGVHHDAYLKDVGWKHQGLVDIAHRHGFYGERFDWSLETQENAFNNLQHLLRTSPVIVSVYKNFKPEEKGGHLVVVSEMSADEIVILDPDANTHQEGLRKISKNDFLHGWKRRGIVIYKENRSC